MVWKNCIGPNWAIFMLGVGVQKHTKGPDVFDGFGMKLAR